ncbi:MAG: hypothetical protein BWY81_01073 [Firmicutes bacterium ADurb.Bin467]|nr:MAG: hypothetical protein BWY81_01073 [Firmicutes bacterium ADurb.Bin467]
MSLRALSRACGNSVDAKDLCKNKLNELYASVSEVLSGRVDALMRLTEALVEREAMTGEEVDEVLNAA